MASGVVCCMNGCRRRRRRRRRCRGRFCSMFIVLSDKLTAKPAPTVIVRVSVGIDRHHTYSSILGFIIQETNDLSEL